MRKQLPIHPPEKAGFSAELILKQLLHESDTWKRSLGYIIEENIHLKNRLSSILKDRFDKSLLGQLESFQTRFLKEDERIRLLRNDIVELDKLLNNPEAGTLQNEINQKRKKIRNNIISTENQFGKLKIEFNSYLSENI